MRAISVSSTGAGAIWSRVCGPMGSGRRSLCQAPGPWKVERRDLRLLAFGRFHRIQSVVHCVAWMLVARRFLAVVTTSRQPKAASAACSPATSAAWAPRHCLADVMLAAHIGDRKRRTRAPSKIPMIWSSEKRLRFMVRLVCRPTAVDNSGPRDYLGWLRRAAC